MKIADRSMEILIENDGKKFVIEDHTGMGIGFVNMRKRMTDTGGGFKIESTPNCSTRITIAATVSELK